MFVGRFHFDCQRLNKVTLLCKEYEQTCECEYCDIIRGNLEIYIGNAGLK